MLERLKKMVEERTEEFAVLINVLIRDEIELDRSAAGNIDKEMS